MAHSVYARKCQMHGLTPYLTLFAKPVSIVVFRQRLVKVEEFRHEHSSVLTMTRKQAPDYFESKLPGNKRFHLHRLSRSVADSRSFKAFRIRPGARQSGPSPQRHPDISTATDSAPAPAIGNGERSPHHYIQFFRMNITRRYRIGFGNGVVSSACVT